MTRAIRTIALAAAFVAVAASFTAPSTANSSGEQALSGSWSHTVKLGRHAKVSAAPSNRQEIQRFYRDGLGCLITTESERDRIHLGADYFITIVYSESKPYQPRSTESVWLELQTDDPLALKERVMAFGGRPVEAPDPAHFIFQAPDGVVYRIVGTTEDLSKFER